MSSVWDYFTHAFCINLDRRPDRWESANRELARCGIPRCERFSGFDRRDAPGGGASGCGASHRAIWRRVASGQLGERVLIFEDDFAFVSRADLFAAGFARESPEVLTYDSLPGESATQRFAELLVSIPAAWHLLYLGGGYECMPYERTNEHVIRNAGMLTAHAYAITPPAARLLTFDLDARYGKRSELDPETPSPTADWVLGELARTRMVRSYTVTPRLFVQRFSPSDIVPRPAGFAFDQVDTRHEAMVR